MKFMKLQLNGHRAALRRASDLQQLHLGGSGLSRLRTPSWLMRAARHHSTIIPPYTGAWPGQPTGQTNSWDEPVTAAMTAPPWGPIRMLAETRAGRDLMDAGVEHGKTDAAVLATEAEDPQLIPYRSIESLRCGTGHSDEQLPFGHQL